ncbi:MAG: 16S rRNA processing protein RimM [Alphaproteobacteria bacterium]|nr:16S rRNA processing protein RimM [Alphaproteobacteria bacterium]
MILLAVIGAAHGIQGAVKVKTFSHHPENIFSYGVLQDEKGKHYTLKLVRPQSADCLIVKIEGINSRTEAEGLRGTKLYVDRSQLPALGEEEFYESDLIGLVVKDLEGKEIGHIKAFGDFGAGSFLEIIDMKGRLLTLPFTQEAVPIISMPTEKTPNENTKGFICIDPNFLMGEEPSPNRET